MRKLILMLAVCAMVCGCGSQRGSSTLKEGQSTTVGKVTTPKIKSSEQLAAQEEAAAAKVEQAKQEAEAAEAASKAAVEQQKAEAEAAATQALQTAQQKAEEEVQRIAQQAVAREEKVTVIENFGYSRSGNYFVIIGSFKKHEGAVTASKQAIAQDLQAFILENSEGLYRIAVYNTADEKTARLRLAKIKTQYPEYAEAWLLISK